MRYNASITTWLLLLVLVPVLPLFGFWLYSTYGHAAEREKFIRSELTLYAESLAGTIRDRLENSYGYVASLAISRAALQNDIPGLYMFAQRIQDSNPSIQALSLVDRDERVLFLSLRPLGEELPLRAAESVRKVFETGQPHLSSPFPSPFSDAVVVALSVPILRDGRVAHCLSAILTTASINDLLVSAHLPPDWIASVINASGTIVARAPAPELHVGQPAASRTLEAIQRQEPSIWPGMTRDGIATQTVLRQIGRWDWYLTLGVPERALLAKQKRLIERVALTALLLFGTSAAAVLWMSRRITRGMRETVEATDAVLQGGRTAVADSGIREFNQMRASLTAVDRYNRLLEQRVQERTADLVDAQARLAAYAADLDRSIESERRRIAREVHDQIGSVFTGIKMILSGQRGTELPPAQREALMAALDTGLQTARRISAELRPPLFDDLGLESALELLLETQLGPLQMGHDVVLQDQDCLNEQQAIGCYRIVQEACTNVIRHAQATHFSIRGGRWGATGYRITISDDGRGMPQAGPRKGAWGMLGMQERAHLMGATLDVGTSPEGGVLLTLHLPLAPPHPEPSHEDSAA